MSGNLPRFISEKDVEARKQRDEAEGKTEEPYDPRPLYDRLQTERARKQEEYETANAFKNQIHRLDPEESAFLAKVEQEKARKQECADQEAQLLMQEAKAAGRASLLKASAPSVLVSEVSRKRPPIPVSNRLNQKSLLAGIKRKPPISESSEPKKHRTEQTADIAADSGGEKGSIGEQTATGPVTTDSQTGCPEAWPEARVRVGVLPGLDNYGSGDDDDDGESCGDHDCSSDCSSEASSGSSTDVEDAALLFTPLILTRGSRRKGGSGACE